MVLLQYHHVLLNEAQAGSLSKIMFLHEFFGVVADPAWVQYLICNQVATSVFYGVLYRHFCILWCPVSTLCILCCPVATSVFYGVLYPHFCISLAESTLCILCILCCPVSTLLYLVGCIYISVSVVTTPNVSVHIAWLVITCSNILPVLFWLN